MVHRDVVLRDMIKRDVVGRVNHVAYRPLLGAMGTHRNLLAWQEAMKLAAQVYRETDAYPSHERYGLVIQTRKAAVSIPSNIAERAGRNTTGELMQFLGVASGSLAELETEIELGSMLHYLPGASTVMTQLRRVGRLLAALRESIRSKL